jgi:hypothetical protein
MISGALIILFSSKDNIGKRLIVNANCTIIHEVYTAAIKTVVILLISQ